MCGILCLICNPNKTTPLQQIYEKCKEQIKSRGPNFQKSNKLQINHKLIYISASVLWLQGDFLTIQPIETPQSLFAYNGDIFGGDAISHSLKQKEGDTKPLLDKLEHLEDSRDIISLFTNIQGPYAFIYYSKQENTLFFGRDIFGRRSLLLAVDKTNDAVLITSVAIRSSVEFIEIPAIGIFSYNLVTESYNLFSWPKRYKTWHDKLKTVESLIKCSVNIQECTINTPVLFKNPENCDLQVFEDLRGLSLINGFEYLINHELWQQNIEELNNRLENALKSRISTQPKYCRDCIDSKVTCNHCRVGILFSGGVDCSILVVLADKFIDFDTPIDLLNVAFSKTDNYDTPDRLTGLQSLQELKGLCPGRRWNFVEINVPHDELTECRKSDIADLIFPLNTILDDSLGCALWFASRGKSSCYESPCRVLLVGMGADELFGGYTRHRAALKNRGWLGLHEVLEDDWANLPHRNLARDDRVVAAHGRQLRTPYLDEAVVGFAQTLPAWLKTCPSNDLPQGFGEKLLLRALAYRLGLRAAAGLRKRALQFGARIADKKENAHEVSPRLAL